MTPSDLPPSLERLRPQLEDAIDQELRSLSAGERIQPPRRHRRPLFAGLSVAAAAIAAAVVLILSASSATSPAYGIRTNPDGSYNIEVSQLTSDIPAVNAKLASLGIEETIIPVTPNCSYQGLFGGTISGNYLYRLPPGQGGMAPGDTGYLAATPIGNGQYALAQGAKRPPLPTCFATSSPIFQPQATSTTPVLTSTTGSPPASTTTTP
jgi:hypothetical protein